MMNFHEEVVCGVLMLSPSESDSLIGFLLEMSLEKLTRAHGVACVRLDRSVHIVIDECKGVSRSLVFQTYIAIYGSYLCALK